MSSPGKRIVDEAAIERLAQAAARVLSGRAEVVAAYLYGSAARGEPAADIDIAVLFGEPGLDTQELEAIAARLEAEGGSEGLHLDVRPLARTSPRFRVNVLRDGRLLYEGDRDKRLTFEARSLSEWLDFKPTWERMRRLMFDRWADG